MRCLMPLCLSSCSCENFCLHRTQTLVLTVRRVSCARKVHSTYSVVSWLVQSCGKRRFEFERTKSVPSLRAYTYAARKYVRNNVLYLRREGTHLSKDGVVCDCYEVSMVRYLFLCRFWLFFEGLVPEEVLNEHTYVHT